jgi:hypothetical protein
MAIYYISPTGNDSTGNGSAGNPWKTYAHAQNNSASQDEIRIEKQTVTVAGSPNLTWTANSQIVTTSSSLVGTITVGMLIGKPSASGNGNFETLYRVNGINASQITLHQPYYGTTETISGYKTMATTSEIGNTGNQVHINVIDRRVSGGWNLSTETRDGESCLYQPNNGTSSVPLILTDGTVEYLNFASEGFSINGLEVRQNSILQYSSLFFRGRGGVTLNSSLGIFVKQFVVNGSLNTTNNRSLFIGTNNITVEDTLIMCSTAAGATINYGGLTINNGVSFDASGVIAVNTHTALITNLHSQVKNFRAYNCISRACVPVQSNALIEDCEFTSVTAANGIVPNNNVVSVTVRGCYFENFNVAYEVGRVSGYEIIACEFDGCNVGIRTLADAGDVYVFDCSFKNVNNWAIDKSLASGIVEVKGCTIDVGSEFKGIRIVTGASYNSPEYLVMDSFNLADGAYYSNGTVLRDDTILDPEGEPTLKLQYTTLVSVNRTFMPVGAIAVSQGVGGTINYKLRASGVWTGTIIPVVRLNKKIIKTGNAINSVTNGDWDSHSITVSDIEVNKDGELTLEFNINADTTGINVGEIKYE